MNRRASCVGTFEVFEAAHVALRTLLAFSQPVNGIFWPIGMLNWLVAASKLHKHRATCCTAEWPFYSFLILYHTMNHLALRGEPLDILEGGGGRKISPARIFLFSWKLRPNFFYAISCARIFLKGFREKIEKN